MSYIKDALSEIEVSNPTAYRILKDAVKDNEPYERIHRTEGTQGLSMSKDTQSARIKLDINGIGYCEEFANNSEDIKVSQGSLSLGDTQYTLSNCVVTKGDKDSCTLMVEKVTKEIK